MRKFLTTAMAVALASATSYADLQNIEVNGGIRLRGSSYSGGDGPGDRATQFTEQRTNLGWTADFTDEVSAVIEMDSYNIWGDDGRGDVVGGPGTGGGLGEVSLYQAYIELGEAWGTALDIKVGRQEVILGSEFLVGNNSTGSYFPQNSFDGITAVYNQDTYNVTFLMLKVAEADAALGATGLGVDLDTDLYGIYGSYTGLENNVIDGYWLYVRTGLPGDNSELHTIGARIAGSANRFDYEGEIAVQTGDTGTAGSDFDGLAINTELGYTFDTDLQPRIFGGITLFTGSDGGDIGFNRLFSDWEYSEFISNGDLTNAQILRLGFSLQATEKIGLSAVIAHFELDEDAGFATDDIGDEFGLYATYQYSDDVALEFGYAHFFVEEDLFGAGADDFDYVYAEMSISF
jgi:hypothetical protein